MESGPGVAREKAAEALLAAERRTLKLITSGASLTAILEELCATIDGQAPGVISSVLLMDPDGTRLWPAAGPRVPTGWAQAISPLMIGPSMGSCGAAAFTKQRVIVPDIASDPLWEVAGYRDLALKQGLRAAWSEPLLSRENEVLGTFAMYYSTPRRPTENDLRLIEGAVHVAIVAIEGERAQAALTTAFEKLRQDERELREIVDAIPHTIAVLDPEGSTLYANHELLAYTGLTRAEVMAPHFRARVFHPEDVASVREERQKALTGDVPFENEQRIRRRDGQYRWFLIRYRPVCDVAGHVLRWYATGTDIEERKQAEDRARNENFALREEIDRSSMFEEVVGSSEGLRRVLAQVARVARTDSTVLILGETGTGKELIARAIHKQSRRAARAFIRVNCGAIPPSLVTSELFGHERGAFTGAVQRRLGRFEAANGGTLFLDEIGELTVEAQVALLRVLQEREIERIGSNRPVPVDVRVLAATNRDLNEAVASGSFRQDLFYRINVFPLQVPPLRERQDDLPLLAEYLIERYARRSGKRITRISKETLELFRAYEWPGNVRELQNVVERAVILCDGETFVVDASWLKRQTTAHRGPTVSLVGTLAEREREMIESALVASGGRVAGPSGAAARLGIPRQTLDSKIRALQIQKQRFSPP
ncbi:sigma-54-dependent Fis family transcriptional regulator [Anaeromyxobacter sp. Red801]|uniref:sigma-54-dependent Fis family transcriptional regulator n=1 Tax=Anaeromyxobacter sp. Red801 TaxID=3411632 RepID=UPI003BA0B66C